MRGPERKIWYHIIHACSRVHLDLFRAPPGFIPTCHMTTLIVSVKSSGKEQRRSWTGVKVHLRHSWIKPSRLETSHRVTGKAELVTAWGPPAHSLCLTSYTHKSTQSSYMLFSFFYNRCVVSLLSATVPLHEYTVFG